MQLTIYPTKIVVQRDLGDKVRYKNESHFLYHLKKELQKRGNDCIKKLAWKDGNLVDDYMHYIRERKTGAYIVYDSWYQIRCCAEEFNKRGEVTMVLDGGGLK